jgi:hypothetical protein
MNTDKYFFLLFGTIIKKGGGQSLQNQQINMNTPPPVISTKDFLYLEDMLHWNLLAMKKAHAFAERCQDPSIKNELDQIGNMHHTHYQAILKHLQPNQMDQQTTLQ